MQLACTVPATICNPVICAEKLLLHQQASQFHQIPMSSSKHVQKRHSQEKRVYWW